MAVSDAYHEPVLLAETLRYLAPQPGDSMLDATVGGGGHSERIARAIAPGGTLVGLDRDTDALAAANARLLSAGRQISIILLHTTFGKMEAALKSTEATEARHFDGILFDLGVSSHQLDTARGFSFRRDEPLDMRMDVTRGPTATQLLAEADEKELARILYEYGEERFSRRIARALAERRRARLPVETTGELVALIEQVVPRSAWPRDIHVATRAFQALRMAVNEELPQLQAGLEAALGRLKPGGRIVVLSYHSGEDRIVKRFFAEQAGRRTSAPGFSPAAFQFSEADRPPALTLLTRKPITPSPEEIARNPRARSARLRAAQKVAEAR
jgi:16S rRNA (cytosine1402-N4)-methyltransferase